MNTSSTHNRSRRGGLLVKLLLFLIMAFAVGSILWIVLLPSVVVSTIRSRTGFAVKVDKLSVNPFTANVAIKGLVVKNPDGWPAEGFVELREFRADANLFSLLGSRFVANEIVVDVAQVTVVKNQQGTVNVMAFKESLAGKEKSAASESKKGEAKHEFLIKHLVLKFDKMVYADYSSGRPKIKDYDLKISRDMKDVDSVTKIISPFTGTVLGMITGTLSGQFPAGPDMLGDIKSSLQDAGKKTGEKLKGLLDSLDKMKP